MLERLDRGIATALNAVAILCSFMVTGLLFLLVLTRYVLGWNFSAAHDLSLLAAMFLYMTGALIASRRREHLTVDFLPSRLTGRMAKAVHKTVIAFITTIICALFVYWGYEMLAWGLQRPQTTPALRLPLWIPQLSIVIAAVGCFAYALRDLLHGVRGVLQARAPEA
ncbi:TRAP transporter small permease [Fodinicurvata sediminis]|uniref:TRAP transporter small permease n=1 Tax=Fodinicurvata sediminis TaxID=1121832 RepID=UPI00041A8960|nr:TRAP transporter small permease [Fodinicurvata sediminis]